ncbi:MAG: D-aminoacyl-tRNA deacylase [Phycisphaerales bacterium]|nr:D-aminoacyl-tRNA deacylase [Phycisphaerales bacterium]
MLAVVQRVSEASVEVEGHGVSGAIGRGFCVFLGVVKGDTEQDATWIAGKIARMRIFNDEEGRFNRSLHDVEGAILLVSQFTLAGDCSRGNRPSFIDAAPPELAEALYESVATALREAHGLSVETGMFRTSMRVHIENDGPATILLDSSRAG